MRRPPAYALIRALVLGISAVIAICVFVALSRWAGDRVLVPALTWVACLDEVACSRSCPDGGDPRAGWILLVGPGLIVAGYAMRRNSSAKTTAPKSHTI